MQVGTTQELGVDSMTKILYNGINKIHSINKTYIQYIKADGQTHRQMSQN